MVSLLCVFFSTRVFSPNKLPIFRFVSEDPVCAASRLRCISAICQRVFSSFFLVGVACLCALAFRRELLVRALSCGSPSLLALSLQLLFTNWFCFGWFSPMWCGVVGVTLCWSILHTFRSWYSSRLHSSSSLSTVSRFLAEHEDESDTRCVVCK